MKDQEWVDLGYSLFRKYYKEPPEEMNAPLTALAMTVAPIMQQNRGDDAKMERETLNFLKHLLISVFTLGYEKALSRMPEIKANLEVMREVFAATNNEKLRDCLGDELFAKLQKARGEPSKGEPCQEKAYHG